MKKTDQPSQLKEPRLRNFEIWQLMGILQQNNIILDSYIDILDTEAALEIIEKSKAISEEIQGKPLYEKEQYFFGHIKLFDSALKQENYEFAKIIFDELGYFHHCFMQDTRFKDERMTIKSLEMLLDKIE